MTSKLTREQLHERARENVKALKMASRQTAFESAREEILADLQLAELALAALDSEPVAWTDEQELRDVDRGGCGYLFTVNPVTPHADERRIILLYRHAQPAPVVPEDVRQALSQMDDEIIAELDAEESACRAAMLQSGNSPAVPDCWCRTCRPVVLNDMRFVVCPDCGNKRCPRANDHRNACTGSNEPGQEGSAYPAAPQEVKP